ncbi:hypothetical protein KFK09_001816 [Dendrobium nobile]|uniref:Uncharacterized protein n=1 Tax=Dendrobium nobile TaxID=94219 RepID=A0A8T3CAL7_DENNO|nr:hypothetical protein KFK09_001816 [Dendrobium nobile]
MPNFRITLIKTTCGGMLPPIMYSNHKFSPKAQVSTKIISKLKRKRVSQILQRHTTQRPFVKTNTTFIPRRPMDFRAATFPFPKNLIENFFNPVTHSLSRKQSLETIDRNRTKNTFNKG